MLGKNTPKCKPVCPWLCQDDVLHSLILEWYWCMAPPLLYSWWNIHYLQKLYICRFDDESIEHSELPCYYLDMSRICSSQIWQHCSIWNWVSIESPHSLLFSYQIAGIQLTMNGTAELYSNNSIVTRTDIGTGSSALLCITTSPGCCSSVNNQTGWYFPSGKAVPYRGKMRETKPYYHTRNNPDISKDHHSLWSVKLHRNPNGNTTGIFRCDILDGSQNLQSLYIGIYNSDTGESCSCTELEVGYYF